MNINQLFIGNSFIVKFAALLIIIFIIHCLCIFKKWTKTKNWVKGFYLLCISALLYIFFYNPYSKEQFGNTASCNYYYMNNCGHCKNFTPEWDKFSQSYSGPIKLRKIEMNDAGSDLDKYNVKGFPSILFIDEQGSAKEYDGPRTSDGLNNYFSNIPTN
jgi:thiol-disulfide isomerase/thioredoxin